jgi:hypothetical protein
MEIDLLIYVGIGVACVVGYLLWRRSRDQLYFAGGVVPLERGEVYEFGFSASFPSQEGAESCAKQTEVLGLPSKLFPPSQYSKAWSVHWILVAKPNGAAVRALEAKIKPAVAACGGRYSNLAVSKPGATMSADAG